QNNSNGSYTLKELDGTIRKPAVAGNRIKRFYTDEVLLCGRVDLWKGKVSLSQRRKLAIKLFEKANLYKSIATFVTKRWRKNGFDEDGANQRLVLYINQLHRLKDKINETVGDGFPPIKDNYLEYRGTTKLILDT
ncbi:hypothetical protein BB559_004412, partial [Furculomyces boomerangus]